MIRRPPRSTQSRSSAASDVYKRQLLRSILLLLHLLLSKRIPIQIQVQAFQLLLLKLLSQLFRISLLLAPPLRRKKVMRRWTKTWTKLKIRIRSKIWIKTRIWTRTMIQTRISWKRASKKMHRKVSKKENSGDGLEEQFEEYPEASQLR